MQGQNEEQSEEARRPVAQAQDSEGRLAEAAGPRAPQVRAPRAEGSWHESANADAQHDVILAQRPGEAEGGHVAPVQGAMNIDTTATQAEFVSRLAQMEKTLQGHANQITTWQAEEGHGDVPHAGIPQEAHRNVQQAVSTGQQGETMNADAPQRSTATEGPSQTQPAVQASAAEGGQFLGKLNYMKKLQLFQGNRPALGQEQRSWQEWQGEFTQNAKLCKLDVDMYYEMAEALLSTQMREVWLTYLKVKPEDNTWAGMDSYMGIHYAALDKTVDAEKNFEETKLQVGTEKAWQAYVNAQTEQIADMGASSDRLATDKGIWYTFLKNISTIPDVHTTAFQAYMGSKTEYDALPVQARITKLTPVLQTYMKSKAVGQEKDPAVEPGVGMAGRESAGIWKGSKRYLESESGVQTPDQKVLHSGAEGRKQPDSNTQYHAVPKDVNYLKCPDVGYHDNNESKPYAHGLSMHLQNEGRCLVCWDKSHRIAECPHRSESLKESMETKRQNQGFRGSRRGGRGNFARRGRY